MNPAWDPKKPVAPFDDDGNLWHYPETWRGLHWQEVQPFEAIMAVDGWGRGRSAAYFYLTDVGTERRYPVFISDMAEILQTRDVIGGAIRGTWSVRKKGQNYGIGPAK